MNKKLHQLIVLMSLLIIASSCNSLNRVTIVKRHYSKGNYVSISKKQKPYVYHAPLKKEAIINVPVAAESKEESSSVKQEMVIASSNNSNENLSHTSVLDKINSGVSPEKDEQLAPADTKIKHKFKGLNKFKKANSLLQNKSLHDDEGLIGSLLWLIIVVLLIVWLLALATGGWGLGGLIHVLALIALVLLIIWLIRNI